MNTRPNGLHTPAQPVTSREGVYQPVPLAPEWDGTPFEWTDPDPVAVALARRCTRSGGGERK